MDGSDCKGAPYQRHADVRRVGARERILRAINFIATQRENGVQTRFALSFHPE